MKKREIQERVTEIVEKLSNTWQGTKEGFVKFVSDKKNKKMIKKAAITGSVFALSALMTACSMGVEHGDGRTGLYFEFGGKDKSSQSSTLDPSTNGNEQENNGGSFIFGGDGQDWENDTTGGNNYYDNVSPTTPSTSPSIDPTTPSGSYDNVTPTDPDGWNDDGYHFGGDNNGSSYEDTTNPTEPTNPTDPDGWNDDGYNFGGDVTVDPTEPTNPIYDSMTTIDTLVSKLAGHNVQVQAMSVSCDSDGNVIVYDDKGNGGKYVDIVCEYLNLDANGEPIKSEVRKYILTVSAEAYHLVFGGETVPRVEGTEMNNLYGNSAFVDYVAGQYGIALPSNERDGM